MVADLTAVITASSNGDNTIVAAVAGRRIAVKALIGKAAGTVTITIKRGSTALTGAVPLTVGLPFDFPYCGHADDRSYWFVTDANEAFIVNTNSTAGFNGMLVYRLIGG